MKYVNLTPHDVSIRKESGEVVTFPKTGNIARCFQKARAVSSVDGFSGARVELGDVQGLPAPEPGVIYIVSRIVAEAVKDIRNDVVCPGPAIRDEEGRVIWADGFSVI